MVGSQGGAGRSTGKDDAPAPPPKALLLIRELMSLDEDVGGTGLLGWTPLASLPPNADGESDF